MLRVLHRRRTADRIRDQTLLIPLPVHLRGRILHQIVLSQPCLDLAELDAMAADLDLMIRATQELEVSVGTPARQIAGAIQTLARVAEWIRDEPFRCQIRPVQIPARQSGAADEELADNPDGYEREVRVEHEHRGVRDRRSNREDRSDRRLADLTDGGPDRSLGRTVDVPDAGATLAKRVRERGVERFPSAQQSQARRALPAAVEQIAPAARRRLHDRRVAVVVHVTQLRQLVAEQDLAARHQRQVDFERRDVEDDRRGRREAVARGELHPFPQTLEDVHHAAVDVHDAFRSAGGARRVDHVRRRAPASRAGAGRRSGAARSRPPPGPSQ